MVALRPAAQLEVGYRDAAPEVACSRAELVAVLRVAGLDVRERGRSVTVRRGRERVCMIVPDPRRVTLASVDVCECGGGTLVFETALALVPMFGAITLTEAEFGRYLIDGSRDAAAIDGERKERIAALARSIAEDMKEKAAAWSELVGRP